MFAIRARRKVATEKVIYYTSFLYYHVYEKYTLIEKAYFTILLKKFLRVIYDKYIWTN